MPLIGASVFRYTPPWTKKGEPIKIVYDSFHGNTWKSILYPDLTVVKNEPLKTEINQKEGMTEVKVPLSGTDARGGYVEITNFK